MTVETYIPEEPLLITESARTQIEEVTTNDEPYFRTGLRGGGCSGFEYQFMLNSKDSVQADDTIVAVNDRGVVLDSMSFQYLVGSTVDYKKDLMGAMFTINSPQQTGSCGCGLSVSF